MGLSLLQSMKMPFLYLSSAATLWLLAFSNMAAHKPPEASKLYPFVRPAASFLVVRVVHALERVAEKEETYVHIHTTLDEVDWLAVVERPFVTVHDSVLAEAVIFDAENPDLEWFIADAPKERPEKKRRRKVKNDETLFAEWNLLDDDDEWEFDLDDDNIEEELSVMTADWYAQQALAEADSVRAWAMELEVAEDESPEEALEISEPQTDVVWGALAMAEDLLDELWNLWGDARPTPEGIYGFQFFPEDDDKEFPPANPGFGGFVPR